VIKDEDAANLNPHDWANESFAFSKSFVYNGVKESGVLSEEYVKKGQEISKHRIVLAGYRLANLLLSLGLEDFDEIKS
jgi:hypothetical protein